MEKELLKRWTAAEWEKLRLRYVHNDFLHSEYPTIEVIRATWVTVEQAQAALKVSAAAIRQACKDARLEAVHLDGKWRIDPVSVKSFWVNRYRRTYEDKKKSEE